MLTISGDLSTRPWVSSSQLRAKGSDAHRGPSGGRDGRLGPERGEESRGSRSTNARRPGFQSADLVPTSLMSGTPKRISPVVGGCCVRQVLEHLPERSALTAAPSPCRLEEDIAIPRRTSISLSGNTPPAIVDRAFRWDRWTRAMRPLALRT